MQKAAPLRGFFCSPRRAPERAAWAAYLGVSVLAFVLLSAATPLNLIWILMVVVFDWLSHG
jgi:hypothetical protein